MKYNFDEIVNRYGTNSCKYSGKANELPMWVADMDFHVLPEIKEAILNKANIDSYGYCEPSEQYFESYKKWWKEQHNVEIRKEWMIFSTGVVGSIDSILKRVCKHGDGVILLTPVYNVFYNCIRNNNLTVEECELKRVENQFEIDWNSFTSLLCKENVTACILCNPHNPTGNIWSKEDIVRISELCKKNNVLLISDEIHCDITEPGTEYNSALTVSECIDNVIALISPTKAFNLAGIQASAVVCPNLELKELIEKGIGQDDLCDPNYFACEATVAAFTYGKEWNKQMREYVYQNKLYMRDYFEKNIPSLQLIEGQATYLVWVDISKVADDSKTFAKNLREETGLWICDGERYGKQGRIYVRINIATSLDNVKKCCEKLNNFINK